MKNLWIFLLFTLAAEASFGACSLPAGNSGDIRWDSTNSMIRWCSGSTWVNPIVSPGISCVGEPAGRITYGSSTVQFCDGSFWQNMKGNQLDSCFGEAAGVFRWSNTRRLMQFCDGVNWHAMYSAAAPSVSTVSINSGATMTRLNNVAMHLSAASNEAYSNITHFCFKHSTSGTPPAAPDKDDSCWVPVNYPSPGIEPGNTISFSNFFYSVGFTPATYTIFGWTKNGADLISSLSNTGNGTAGTDKASINYSPGFPPTLINVFATNSNSSSIPPVTSDLTVVFGNDVFIKWHLSDDEALPGSPIEISYTTDEVNYTTIATGITNSANSGCTIDGVNSTGCYVWSGGAPSNGYFKIRLQAVDATGLSAIASAEPNNMSSFKVLAGTTDPGLGGSAASAIIYPYNKSNQTETGAGNFVVRDNGTMYLADDRGLMMVDPNDGNYKIFLPYTGTSTDGPIASATLRQRPLKLSLDYSDRLIIFDYDRIRRVDFSAGTVTTFIGGGGSTGNGTPALDFYIDPPVSRTQAMLFTVLPNGNIWFQTSPDQHHATRSAGIKLRYYQASDNKVYEWIPTGTGSLEDGAFDPSGYAIPNFGLSFNPVTSEVTRIRSRSIIPHPGGHTPRSVSYDPVTAQTTTPHIPFVSYWADDNTLTSRNGEMYSVERFVNVGMHKYNSSTNSWDRIIGNGQRGQCPDGTPVTSCPTDITDAFITAQNQIYVIDRGLIRTIDSSGNMLTIFGQALTYGDGGLAVNARLNTIPFIALSSSGKIALVDSQEHVIREFTPDGNIMRLAGNGTDGAPDTTALAAAQPLNAGYWGGPFPLSADSSDGTIFFTRGGSTVSKLDRATGKWVDIVGGGGTSYASADGLDGNQIILDGYGHGAIGYNGSQVLYHTQRWNGTFHPDAMIKAYDKTTGNQSSLAGVPAIEAGGSIDSCADGTALNACAIPPNFGNSLTKVDWDSANSRWLIMQNGSNKIRTAVAGGVWGTLATLPRGANSFTYVLKSSVPHVYYCSGGRMFKYNISTSTDTELPWPSSSIVCVGASLVWHPTRQSIVFPMVQNGLGAIAEIKDP